MDVLRSLVLGRWLVLLAVVPYLVLLGRLDGSGGFVAVVAVALAALYFFAIFDLDSVRSSGQVRLSLRRERGGVDVVALERARLLFGVGAALVGLVLLFTAPWAGAVFLGVVVLLWLVDVMSERTGLWSIEFDLPALTLVLPLAMTGLLVGVVPAGVVMLSVCGAFLLGGYCILCLIRDEQLDRGEGRRTVATVLGGGGASVMFFVFASMGVVLAIGTASASGGVVALVPWEVSALLAVASAASLWAVASGAAGVAASLWLWTIVVFAVVCGFSGG